MFQIADHSIGPHSRCFIIAEAGVNHNGAPHLARQLIDVAADARADAVKFQTFRADAVASEQAPKAAYQISTTGSEESQLDMLRRLELDDETFRSLQAYCRERAIIFLSTPFDEASADFLDSLDVPAFKLPSGEVTNLPFIEHVAKKGRAIILSTGMSGLDQVTAAVDTIRQAGDPDLALLHCVSAYPAEPRDANLRAMATLAKAFDVPVGFSDHTLGIDVTAAAVAAGACIIEKHFTTDRTLPGPDHQTSLEPKELSDLVKAIRRVEGYLGDGEKRQRAAEAEIADMVRKSLVAARDLMKGDVTTEAMVTVRRPGTGLAPTEQSSILGRRLDRDVAAGTPLSRDMFE